MNIKKILSVGLFPVFMLSVFAFSIPQVFATSVVPAPAPAPCTTVGTPFLTLTQNITNDLDSGVHGDWATDAFTEHVNVWLGSDNATYCANASTTNGMFVTTGPNSPEAGTPLVAGITGTFTGGENYTIPSSTPLATGYSTSTPTSTTLADSDTAGFSWWVNNVFPSIATSSGSGDVNTYSLTYVTLHDGTWTDADSGDVGDIGPVVDVNTRTGYSTIQAAVTAASSGDVIDVASGTYLTPLGIDLTKNITIEGAGMANTILTTNSSGPSWIKIESGDSLTLKDLTMDGAGASIDNGAAAYGKHGGALEVHGSIAVNNVAFKNITSAVSPYDTDAIVFYGYGANNVLSVTSSTFSNIGRDGIYLGMAPAVATTQINQITGNTYAGKGSGNWLDYFATVNYGAKADISGNTISNNTGVASSDGSNSAGIAVWDDPSTQATLTGNTFKNNTDGIAIAVINGGTTDPAVTIGPGNVFTGGVTGVHIQNAGASGAPMVVITSSTFSDNGNGVTIDVGEAANNVAVHGSTFSGEATSGITNDGTSTLAAQQNWWGAASGPLDTVSTDGSTPATNASGTGSPAVGAVNYASWCINSGCVTDAIPPVVTVTPVGGITLSGTTTFNITVTDNNLLDSTKNTNVWVYLYNNGGTQKLQGAKVNLSSGTGTFTVDTTKLDNGISTLDVGQVSDAAGNLSGSGDNYFGGYDIENSTSGPSVPTLLWPVNDDITPTNVFTFKWNPSTSSVSGPVTYDFHSSMNPAEADGVLTTGLWDSGTLTTSSILSTGAPDGTWYWQVRAEDANGNISSWSSIWAVTLNTVSPPAIVSCASGTTPTFVETDVVNSDSYTPIVGTSNLTNGQTYLLVASGTWNNGGLNLADPAYASVDSWTTYMQGYNISPSYLGLGEFQLRVDGSFVNWGAYQPAHEYSYLYNGTGNPINLMVFDGDSTTASPMANASWYGDNNGSLTVNVYSCKSNTPSPATYITTDSATNVTSTSATVNGANGTSLADNTSFWWGTTSAGPFTAGGNTTEFPSSGWNHDSGLGTASVGGSFSEPLTNLTPSTTYYYVAWSFLNGTWYPGAVMNFTTAQAPYITTDEASGVATSTATVNGTNGPVNADDTSFWLGTTSSGSFVSSTNPGSELPSGWYGVDSLTQPANESFSYTYNSLTPSTTYYYAAWSEIGGVWYPGDVMTFTTPALGSDDTLSALGVSAGSLSPSFNSATTSYTDLLPYNTSVVPTVTATTTDPNATEVITPAANTTGTATVAVTAQNGAKQDYTVAFSLAPATTTVLNVIVNVDNSRGGSATSSDFTVNVVATNPNPTSTFPGSAAGTEITIDPNTFYGVNISSLPNYTEGTLGSCNSDGGGIAGDFANCTITEIYHAPTLTNSALTSISGGGGSVQANIGITNVVDNNTPATGSTIHYTLTVSAAGPSTPVGLVVNDVLPAGLTFVSASSPEGSYNNSTGVWTLDPLNVGQTATLTITATVTASAGTAITNTATVSESSGVINSNVANDSPSVTINVSGTSTGQVLGASTSTTGTSVGQVGQVLGASTTNPVALLQQLQNLEQQLVTLEFKTNSCSFTFNTNLSKGMTSPDVKNLQTVLNYALLTQVAATGPGSPNNENTYFGSATKNAVIAFQNIFADQILTPNGLTSGNGYVGSATRSVLNGLCGQ